MNELVLDPAIRGWVVLPILIITFLVLLGKHYLTIWITVRPKPDLKKIEEAQALARSRMLRANGRFLTPEGFAMRRHFFNNPQTGYFEERRQPGPPPNPMAMMSDPRMMQNMMKGNVINMLPMMVIGGAVGWIFSGFLTIKVPFPLTIRFKPMLQRGIELDSLSASWVSSMSFYFICVFGLRSIFTLLLGNDNEADTTAGMKQQMQMQASPMPQDNSKAFQAEHDNLEVLHHRDALAGVEQAALQALRA